MDDPAALVDLWQERAWGQGDVDVVDEVIAEGYVRHGPAGTVVRTREELKDDLRQYQRTLHKPVISIDDRAVVGDKVWSRVTMRGVNLETGEPRTVNFLQIHRVEAGRIAEVWSLYTSESEW